MTPELHGLTEAHLVASGGKEELTETVRSPRRSRTDDLL